MATETAFHQGQLTVSQVMANQPATVPLGTPLLEVVKLLGGTRYRHVLVKDDEGRLAGVIPSNELLQHLAEWSADEDVSWKNKTVESVMTTKFLASSPDADWQDVAPLMTSGSIECVPVLEGNKLVGVLTTDDLLLSWSRLDPLLRDVASDSVTELANRATFDRRLSEEWDRAARRRNPLGLIIIDVDNFKQVNDKCGHVTGDAVLNMVGTCLKRQLRKYDVVARYGGDEFAAFCYDCSTENIEQPIMRLQKAIRSLSIPSQASRQSITLSIGAATIHEGFEHARPADLIAAADDCLYKAKRKGRDRAYRVTFDGRDHSVSKQVRITGS